MFHQLLILASLLTLYSSPIYPVRPADNYTDQLLVHIRDTSPGNACHERTTLAIVWSCAATILACVWRAIHPNIPGPRDSSWKVLRRHVITMYCALIAPEFMASWALEQQISAREMAEKYNKTLSNVNPVKQSLWQGVRGWFTDLPEAATERGNIQPWTTTHGFFMQMDGFMLYKDNYPLRVLGFENMCALIKTEQIDPPTVTEMEIQDRSKVNALSKAVVVLQTWWFVIQCLARLLSGLPLSELEVITIGFAFLNGIMHWVWWEKPQGVNVAIPIPLKEIKPCNEPPPSLNETAAELEEHGRENCTVPTKVTATPEEKQFMAPVEEISSQQSNKKDGPQLLNCKALAATLLKIIQFPFIPLAKMIADDVIPQGATRVPMFYAPKGSTDAPTAMALIIEMLFGGVYFLAWSFKFPSPAEKHIWHFSTVLTVAGPLIITQVAVLKKHTPHDNSSQTISYYLAIGLSLAYVLACISLLTVALLSLRALPQEVFVQINWTSFIPHF